MAADLLPVPAAQLERFGALGVDIADVLRRANIARSRFDAAKAYVTTAEYFALWRAVEEVAPAPDLGLRFGTTNVPALGSIAALHSATFGDALAKLARYKRLVCPEQITIDVVRGEARVRFEWLLAEAGPPRLLIDAIFASVVAMARKGTGKAITPRRVELARRRGDEVMLKKHFACEIRFDAPADVLVFDKDALAEPFTTHNPQLLELVVPGLEAALRDKRRKRTLADDVRAALSQQMSGERPAVERVARTLGMSGRTLQRRLTELGTTYQELLDDVRRRSARRLLAQTDLEASEVAFLLGFEEMNSFTRAFHDWEGTTPIRWRSKGARV
jgi:AraC-like DNA-binding protein